MEGRPLCTCSPASTVRAATGGSSATSFLQKKLATLEAKVAAELADTKKKLATLEAKVAALAALETQTSPASGSLVGTLLALGLTAAAVA